MLVADKVILVVGELGWGVGSGGGGEEGESKSNTKKKKENLKSCTFKMESYTFFPSTFIDQ